MYLGTVLTMAFSMNLGCHQTENTTFEKLPPG